jgi:hypothetical protein
VDHLNGADDAPWSEWRGVHGNQQPHKLSPGELAKLLEPFQIRPRTIRIFAAASGKPTVKGYYRLSNFVPDFLSLRTWVDFRAGQDQKYAYHVLCQGIRGQPVGPWPQMTSEGHEVFLSVHERRIRELQRFRTLTRRVGSGPVASDERCQ